MPSISPDTTSSIITDSTVSTRPNMGQAFMRMKAQIESEVKGMLEGKVDAKKLLRKLQAQYMRMTQRRNFPEVASVRGAKLLKIVYRTLNKEMVKLYWDWLPGDAGTMVVGVCPECFVNAPTHVDGTTQSMPTFIEQRLAYVQGNPEADAKVVTFQLAYPQFHMRIDERNRLTIREVIRCPSGRHGPEQRVIRRCDWSVRVEDGIATRVSRMVGRSTTKRPITGPLIIVK